MPFEQIENLEKGGAPSFENGARISYHQIKKRNSDEISKYVKITLGKNTATALSFISDKHNCRLLFGNGEDAGQIAVAVDNSAGDFPAVKNSRKEVAITIKGKTAALRFREDFETIYLDDVKMLNVPNKGKMGILHLEDHPEIFAEGHAPE